LEMLDNIKGSLQAVNGGLDSCVQTPHGSGQGQMLLWRLHCIFAQSPLQHWM